VLLLNVSIITVFFVVLIILLVLAGAYFLFRIKPAAESESVSNCYENSYRYLSDAVIILNNEKKFVYLNPAAEAILGCKLRAMMGRKYQDAFSFKYLKTGRLLPEIIGGETPKSCECLLDTEMSQSYSIDLSYTPITGYAGENKSHSYLLVIKDITRQKLNELQLSNLKRYDSLTEMLKPKSFEAEVKHLLDNFHKYNSKHVLAYFSIDQFQSINDSIGYAGADSLIKTIGDVINKHIKRRIDIAGKLDGGEFVVVFRDDGLPLAIQKMKQILNAVEKCNYTSLGKQYPTTLSAGFVIIDDSTSTAARAISEAGFACKVARKHGGNQLYAYKAGNEEIRKLEGNLEWIIILKRAMQKNQFQMYAQPIQRLDEAEYNKPFYHFELLIRLFDEKGKLVPPDEFLPAAEYYSMMPKIDRWVVRNVMRQINKIPRQKPLPVFAINLSGQSLNDPRFLDFVVEEVKSSGVDPQMLCFEITEQVAVDDVSLVNQFISRLKTLGSKFSLDDFGTGVSGFSYLMSLDVDYLKIDGCFVKNIHTDEVSRSMVQSICQVGHTMDLEVIAEYVENHEIVEVLRDIGVDFGQGYHIQKPGPLADVISGFLYQGTENTLNRSSNN